nr:MAG TPA: hypothetical protein [Caudoviricetes sp.]
MQKRTTYFYRMIRMGSSLLSLYRIFNIHRSQLHKCR